MRVEGRVDPVAVEFHQVEHLVEGVARVEIWGAQPKVIYLEASETQLSQIGISDKSIIATVQQQNMVVDAGSVDVQQKRVRIAPTGEFNTPEDIADLQIHPSLIDSLQTIERGQPLQTSDELIRIRDIGTVSCLMVRRPPGSTCLPLTTGFRSESSLVQASKASVAKRSGILRFIVDSPCINMLVEILICRTAISCRTIPRRS